MKMRQTELRAMIKQCVRECIREIMQEQLDPTVIQGMLSRPAQGLSEAQGPLGIVNPFDERQMRLRQEILQQKNAIAGQLQRRSMGQGAHQHLAPLAELAGVPDDPSTDGRRYNSTSSGYVNPSDRTAMAGPPVNLMRLQHGSGGHLDAPMGYPAYQPQAYPQRPMMLDPGLDTPLAGGDMRAPNPDVLRSIFEDTARTTYVTQAAAGHTRPSHHDDGGGGMNYSQPADRFAAVAAQHSPDELFTGSDQWAALAFASAK